MYVLKILDLDRLHVGLEILFDDEQSVMKSGRLFQARGPATANAWSPVIVLAAAAGQMKMMTAVDVVK